MTVRSGRGPAKFGPDDSKLRSSLAEIGAALSKAATDIQHLDPSGQRTPPLRPAEDAGGRTASKMRGQAAGRTFLGPEEMWRRLSTSGKEKTAGRAARAAETTAQNIELSVQLTKKLTELAGDQLAELKKISADRRPIAVVGP